MFFTSLSSALQGENYHTGIHYKQYNMILAALQEAGPVSVVCSWSWLVFGGSLV